MEPDMARAGSKAGNKTKSGSKSAGKARTARIKTRRGKAGSPKTSRSQAHAARPKSATLRSKPIELYYWPTPNGWKISIMLEECRLAYKLRPVNLSVGEQFKPEFLAISPNNRMPAIVDPDGPGRKPISIFESGAILQYLGRKTGKFYPANERARVEVEQWLFWQMAGLGPMAGQAHHFRSYAPEQLDYPIKRYTNEVNRLYGVMNKRLVDREFLAGPYSIADMACVGWAKLWKRQGQEIEQFPHLKRWLERVLARPAVQRGIGIRVEEAGKVDMKDPKVWGILFEQRARA
jgi:GST-like protein